MRPWAFVTVAVCCALPLCAQQGPFRGRTDLVSVYATVTDRNGRLVTDLARDDFEVRDNGKLQKIVYFSSDLQPITGIVMLDRSFSMLDNFPLVEGATEQFIGKLMPADRIRIGDFSRRIVLNPSDFTSRQEELLDIVHHGLQDFGPSPVWTAIDRSITALLGQEGRRVILVFTDGHNTMVEGQIATDLKDVARRAMIDEVMVYAIGLWQNHEKPDAGLRILAEQSGGGYFELDWTQNLGATFSRVADELHRQYGLAFAPAKLDGEIHRLDVKTTRPGLVIRTRKSYVAEAR
jgi:Ca-activated chloride channel family protein